MEEGVFSRLNSWFWSEDVWLPKNMTWEIIRRQERAVYAQFSELYNSLLVAIVLLFVRYVLERILFTPIGVYFGLKATRPKKAPENPVLEKAFKANGRIPYKQIQGLAKQLDWSGRKVERWLRQRTIQEKPLTITKFTESLWRFTFYLSAFLYGLFTLFSKPWLWDTRHCWYDYPHQSVTSDMWWYYMVELGFYWSLTFSQFMDIKRKDFLQMFLHHIITISLLSFSWACNFWRIGTLVMLIHDFADIPLEVTKMCKYLKKQNLADISFIIFTLAWIVSRLGLFPCRIIYSTMYEAIIILDFFPVYYIFNSLLLALQCLHIVWTWIIVRIAIQAIRKGVKDLRSDDSSNADSSSCSDENISNKTRKSRQS
ncbi:ceramide synthase 6-like [Limulus polyphemus]|uniref:Ceramide synthase 6-like n=1 Tax=Limulus polyphemus TaxID=6850 RepID=A0ABM1BZ01_LIMPO|nr:ceramide synthase 6-like [Limulus polyphemus]